MGVDVLADREGRLLALEANAPFGFDVTDPAQEGWVAEAALEAAAGPTPEPAVLAAGTLRVVNPEPSPLKSRRARRRRCGCPAAPG